MVNMTALAQTWSIPSAGLTFNTGIADANGNQWMTMDEKGWHGSAAPRPGRTAKPASQGSYRSPLFRDSRIFSLTGWVSCPSRLARNNAEHQLAAIFPDPYTLYQVICNEEFGSLYVTVELDTMIQVTPQPGGFDLLFTLQMAAPDPRKYSTNTASASTGLPLSTGGLDWATGGGLNWSSGGGLNWGTVTSSGQISMANTGTADTYPTYTISAGANPLVTPAITIQGTGATLFYNGTLNAGDALIIVTNPFGRAVTLNGSTDRRPLLTTAQWTSIPAGTAQVAVFSANAYSSTATLAASWQPAFW